MKIVRISTKKMQKMTAEQALKEFNSKKRRMGCVSAVDWFCKRVDGFYPKRKTYTIKEGKYRGETYEHVVATNGIIEIDVAPYANKPRD